MGHKFQAIEVGGRWWEPVTKVCNKCDLRGFIETLKKYRAEYFIRQKHSSFRFQLYIPKKEYDRIEKKYRQITRGKHYNNVSSTINT